MAGGRPRKPTRLRLAEGNPGRRPLPKNEPKPKVCLPRAPAHLDQIARAAWGAIGGRLLGMKVMTDADAKALELVCMAYSQFRRAQAVVADLGMTCEVPVLNKDGEEIGSRIKKRPEVEIAVDAWRRVMRGLIEFGLTPSSRTKVQVAGPARIIHEGSAATVDLAAISGGFAVLALEVLHEYAGGPKPLQAPILAAICTVSLRTFMKNPG